MGPDMFIAIISLIICTFFNAYCCAFVHVERYITLHEPLLVIPFYSKLAKMGLGIPAIVFWIIPTIVASVVTANIFVGIVYFILAQLLAPTSLIMIHRFKKRVIKPNMESEEPWQKDRNTFYEWMIRHPEKIMDYSKSPLDPFLVYMESTRSDELHKKLKIKP